MGLAGVARDGVKRGKNEKWYPYDMPGRGDWLQVPVRWKPHVKSFTVLCYTTHVLT